MKWRIIILLVLLVSCGSKKKAIERSKERSVVVEQQDVQSNIKNDITKNVSLVSEGDVITIKPTDPSKPSKYGDLEFENAEITKSTSKDQLTSETSDQSETNLTKNDLTKTDKSSEALNKDLDVDRSFNVFDWIWLFMAVGIVLFAIRLYIKKINPLDWIKNHLTN